MRAIFTLIVVLFTTTLLLQDCQAYTSNGVRVSNVSIKKTDYASGSAWFTITCKATNKTNKSGTTYVTVVGYDKKGVQLHESLLSGFITRGRSAKLTDKDYMDYKAFRKVKRWKVEEAVIY